MPAIQHILFPLDFSDRALATTPLVAAMAKRYHAKVTLLTVAPQYPNASIGDPGGPILINPDDVMDELKIRLGHVSLKNLDAQKIERVAEVGDPAREITDFAHANQVDLIMMSTHGYGPFRALLLGSVAATVLHDAECPVWTAAHANEPPVADHVQIRNILCAVDGTSNSVSVLKWAAELKKDTGGNLRLIHVMANPDGGFSHEADRQFEENMLLEARQRITGLQAQAGVVAPLSVCFGNVAEEVRDEARRHGADIVVIGRGVLNQTLGRLRTHAYAIIRQSPCPVISV